MMIVVGITFHANDRRENCGWYSYLKGKSMLTPETGEKGMQTLAFEVVKKPSENFSYAKPF